MNKCLIGRGATENSSEPITVVPELKRYVRNSKTSCDNNIKNNKGDGQTLNVKHCMTDRWFSRILGSLGRSYVLRHPRSTCT